jgi:Domain of Unknown Function (DUF1080)
MRRFKCFCTLLFLSGCVNAGDGGFEPLFNGKDLFGWTGTNEQKEHWKTDDGALVFDGKPGNEEPLEAGTQSRLSTKRTFGDFELVFDWMPSGKTKFTNLRYCGNGMETGVVSGVITFRPGGSICVITPPTAAVVQKEAELPVGKWNRVNIRVKDTKVSVRINGKTALESYPQFRVDGPGAISFDGEGEMRLRNIEIRELKDNK